MTYFEIRKITNGVDNLYYFRTYNTYQDAFDDLNSLRDDKKEPIETVNPITGHIDKIYIKECKI